MTIAPSFTQKYSKRYIVHLFLLGAQLVWVGRKAILPRARMTLSWAPMWHVLVTMCYFCIAVTNMHDRRALKKEVCCGSFPTLGMWNHSQGLRPPLGVLHPGQRLDRKVTDRKQRRQ